MATIIIPFTIPGDATLGDATKTEITGGFFQTKDMIPAGVTAYASFTTNEDFTWSDGVVTGNLNGGAVVAAGKLNCLGGAAVKWVNWAGVNNADINGGQFTIVDKIAPGYSNAPTAHRGLFAGDSGGGVCRVELHHVATSGLLFLTLRNNASGVIYSANIPNSTWLPVAGVEQEVELTVDVVTGASKVRIGGVQVGDPITATGTMTTPWTNIYCGAIPSAAFNSDATHDEFTFHNKILHTSDYTAPTASLAETKYATDNPYCDINSTFKTSNWFTFAAVEVGVDASNAVGYAPSNAGQLKYYSGGVVDSDGTYAQSNAKAIVNINAEAFFTTRATAGLRIFLHSDGWTQVKVDSVTITYDPVLVDPTFPSSTYSPSELEGFMYTPAGPLANEYIYIRPYVSGFVNDDVFHPYKWFKLPTPTGADGWFSTDHFVQPSGEFWEMKVGAERWKYQIEDIETNNWKSVTKEVIPDEE